MTSTNFPKVQILKNGQVIKDLPQLNKSVELTLGRHESCNITIPDKEISRFHARINIQDGKAFVTDTGSANKTWLNDNQLSPNQQYLIDDDSIVKLAASGFSLQFNFAKVKDPISGQIVSKNPKSEILERLNSKGQVLIGRDNACDIVLKSLNVSRQHALIEKQNEKIYVSDLNSSNGVYINGKRINQKVEITNQDSIGIGSSIFYLRQGKVDIPYAIIAENIVKVYNIGTKKETVGLQKVNINIPSKEFVALMGPSGCGKSTLLKGLNGANPVTEGSVTIQGLPLNSENFNVIKKFIGYVPQDDIIHKELTLEQTMYYAAKLRMASDIEIDEITSKINEVLKNLNIGDQEFRKKLISELSGGQRKRVSIAVELLNDPKILFLDEPTSPLDPETIEDFLECIQELVKKDMTVVMVTHKPDDLAYVDKVIFLSKGGYLTYYGKVDQLVPYFNKKRIIEIYSLFKTKESGANWNKKWNESHPAPENSSKNEDLGAIKTDSYFKQFYWLSRRYFNIKWNDKFNMLLLLSQPFIIAFLLCTIFENLQAGVLFLMAISAIWFGVSNASKEIVGEIPIYERERMYNLSIFTYLFSKIFVLAFIALIQVFVFVFIISNWYTDTSDIAFFEATFQSGIFLFYLSVSATLFGLLISAMFDTTEKVMTIVPIALIPQIMLAGVVAQIDTMWKHIISYTTLGRWGTEGLCHIQDEIAIERGDTLISINRSMPHPLKADSLFTTQGSAVDFIGFYAKDDGLINTQSFDMNTLAILALNIVSFFVLFLLLKRKDKKFDAPKGV